VATGQPLNVVKRVKPKVDPTCEPHDHAMRSREKRPASPEAFERAASFFRAAGDVSRLKLLARLSEGEWCVTELAEAAGVALSTVSQQLRLLRAEHLVTRRRAAKHVYYALADVHIRQLIESALAHASEERRPLDDEK
jgi:DNA-binding transcriptional ArsR family regulator